MNRPTIIEIKKISDTPINYFFLSEFQMPGIDSKPMMYLTICNGSSIHQFFLEAYFAPAGYPREPLSKWYMQC